ncbi:unnamed protein product [Somion occarium]|uniref:Uncharacterized protein n=1 Tax=Somion occarium TaxID=3059160 RepID=A0ABP1DBU3_9APHY
MTAIVSPKPRLASRSRAQSPQPLLLPPSLYLATDLPRHMASASLASPPRLLSPIHLADSPSYYAKASSSCNTPQKRRTQSGATRNARRRHCARFDCAAFANGGSIFDQLAWIPQLHQEPERVDVWDIADLSLLPIEPFHHRASGVGPVRSRKLSLRSDPLSCGSSAAQDRIA